MKPSEPNPQPADPFRRKIRAAEYARLYGMSIQGVHNQIKHHRIAAEQPAGAGSTWFVWLDADNTSERKSEERLILEALRQSDAA